jgi:hypothetical protein
MKNDASDKDDPLEKEKKLELEKEQILKSVVNSNMDTMLNKVAWILNHYPDARDSDITCQLKYWSTFEPEISGSGYISVEDLYKLTRLTSITRARARIQNTHRLFLANPEVQKRRGVLEDEEKEKALEQKHNYPVYSVYADESGKTSDYLVVGSMWILDGIETYHLTKRIEEWKKETNFKDELHFQSINNNNIGYYREVLEIVKNKSSAISFKAISLERKGIKSVADAFTHLYYHLLVRGVEHEHSTGRAPLPRSIQLWKDAEEPGSDKLMILQIRERLQQAAKITFDDKLQIDEMRAIDSRNLLLIQLADLFTSSISRILNKERNGQIKPKDRFAEDFLQTFGSNKELREYDDVGDCVFYANL